MRCGVVVPTATLTFVYRNFLFSPLTWEKNQHHLMVALKSQGCAMYVVYYWQWNLLQSRKIGTAPKGHRETSAAVARKWKLHYSVYDFIAEGRHLPYDVSAIPEGSVWSLKEKMMVSRSIPAMLRIFSFLPPFLLILRCAACHAQERPDITFAFSN